MKFLRDNIIKIILVFGILIVAIIILIACSGKGGNGVKTTSYSKMEDNFKSAATRYLSKHRELLPKEEGKTAKIQMDTIYTEKEMKKMTAIDDPSVRCNGYVNVSYRVNNKEEKQYRVVPHIKCGDKYETEDLYVHILKNEDLVQELDGLYKIGDEYIYRGENPNNFVQIGEHLYRILSIDSEGYIKLILASSAGLSSPWDNRYNIDTSKYNGINDYSISRARANLNEFFESDEFFSETEKNMFVKHSYCVGKRSQKNLLINRTEECQETSDEDYVSLPLLYDYFIVSTDSNCKDILDKSCNNYNYLTSSSKIYTMTGLKETSYSVYIISEVADLSDASYSRKIRIISYISNVSYSSGKGTLEEPYIIK